MLACLTDRAAFQCMTSFAACPSSPGSLGSSCGRLSKTKNGGLEPGYLAEGSLGGFPTLAEICSSLRDAPEKSAISESGGETGRCALRSVVVFQ